MYKQIPSSTRHVHFISVFKTITGGVRWPTPPTKQQLISSLFFAGIKAMVTPMDKRSNAGNPAGSMGKTCLPHTVSTMGKYVA